MTAQHPARRQQYEDRVRELFDHWVRDGRADGMERRHRRLVELVLDRIALEEDARVLDVGCGDGWTGRMLAPRISGGGFVGIDLSEEMILRARRQCREFDNVLFARAGAEEIPWTGDYFTHILSIESAYYWQEVRSAAMEMYRVASWGGTFHVLINYYAENTYSEGWDRETGLPLIRLGAEDWAEQFRACGFESVVTDRIADGACGFESVVTDRIADDSPITPGKSPAELARRQGLQREGALYVTGRKPALPDPAAYVTGPDTSPFRVLS